MVIFVTFGQIILIPELYLSNIRLLQGEIFEYKVFCESQSFSCTIKRHVDKVFEIVAIPE